MRKEWWLLLIWWQTEEQDLYDFAEQCAQDHMPYDDKCQPSQLSQAPWPWLCSALCTGPHTIRCQVSTKSARLTIWSHLSSHLTSMGWWVQKHFINNSKFSTWHSQALTHEDGTDFNSFIVHVWQLDPVAFIRLPLQRHQQCLPLDPLHSVHSILDPCGASGLDSCCVKVTNYGLGNIRVHRHEHRAQTHSSLIIGKPHTPQYSIYNLFLTWVFIWASRTQWHTLAKDTGHLEVQTIWRIQTFCVLYPLVSQHTLYRSLRTAVSVGLYVAPNRSHCRPHKHYRVITVQMFLFFMFF